MQVTYIRSGKIAKSNAWVGGHDREAQKAPEGDDRQTNGQTRKTRDY